MAVGLVASLNGSWKKMEKQFMEMAISDFYQMHPNYTTRLILQLRDSQKDVITSAAAVEDLIKKEPVKAILGPETSEEAHFDIRLGERFKVPIIAHLSRVHTSFKPPKSTPDKFKLLAHLSTLSGGDSTISNALGKLNHRAIQSMQGLLGVQTYVPKTKKSLYGLWAYDATFLLAEAVEKVHNGNQPIQNLVNASFPASLASMLTTEKLQPAYNDVFEFVRAGKRVGYHSMFIREYLRRMNFDDLNMVSYGSPQELHDLFSKGSKGGGINVAFDEAPYINIFLARYCSQYKTVVPPFSKTDGFAFVLPIGSPLVSNISRAMLNIIESDIVLTISKRWIKDSNDCHVDPSTFLGTSSGTLDLDSFVVLFCITGGACFTAVV
ncbi:hypothetical protein V2J09_018113 [Rumex salicifolius]